SASLRRAAQTGGVAATSTTSRRCTMDFLPSPAPASPSRAVRDNPVIHNDMAPWGEPRQPGLLKKIFRGFQLPKALRAYTSRPMPNSLKPAAPPEDLAAGVPAAPGFGEPAPIVTSPETLAFLARRRSASALMLAAPAPTDAELATLLRLATRVPDHGKRSPWRFVILKGAAKQRFVA